MNPDLETCVAENRAPIDTSRLLDLAGYHGARRGAYHVVCRIDEPGKTVLGSGSTTERTCTEHGESGQFSR